MCKWILLALTPIIAASAIFLSGDTTGFVFFLGGFFIGLLFEKAMHHAE